MKMPGWEYKNCGLGQYMRYNKKGKDSFKHSIVFFNFGDPSYADIAEWLTILETNRDAWPNVKVVYKLQSNKQQSNETKSGWKKQHNQSSYCNWVMVS